MSRFVIVTNVMVSALLLNDSVSLHVFTEEGEQRVVVEPSILRILDEGRRHGLPR